MCQRYYEKSNTLGCSGYADGVGQSFVCVANWCFKSEKRASPTVNRITNATSINNVNQPIYYAGGTNSCELYGLSTTSGRTFWEGAIFEAVAEL